MDKAKQIVYLQRFFAPRKARGMAGEISFDKHLEEIDSAQANKMFAGAWVMSPNLSDAENPVNYRIAIFVLPILFSSKEELDLEIQRIVRDRGYQSLFSNLKKSGVGIIVSGAIDNIDHDPDNFTWKNYAYVDERLVLQPNDEPFTSISTGRGRANINHQIWENDVIARFNDFDDESLLRLTLKQAFYYSYLKLKLRAVFKDPYDVDAFLVGYDGSVFPVELKEKSPTDRGEFGIDAGRILMMMRLCITTDSNALYIIREVDGSENRGLVGYRYITFADMIMNVSWNLQAGGAGMGGGSTQTVMMPSRVFKEFNADVLKEEWIAENSSLSAKVKEKAIRFYTSIERLINKAN